MNSQLRARGRVENVSTMHVWAEMKLRTGMAEDLVNVAVAPSEAWAYDPVKACLIASPTDECARAGYRPGSGQLDPMINAEWMRANLAERHRVLDVELFYNSAADSQHPDREVLFRTLAAGEAIDATVLVGDGFWSPGPVLDDYYVDGNSAGHGVALVGFRHGPRGRELLLQNSWGTSWGEGGFVWMPEQMIGKQLINARRLTIVDARDPIPPSNACDRWHRRDLVLDACYSVCRNNIPTINGRCNPLPQNQVGELSCLDPREILSGRCRLPGTDGFPPSLQSLPWPWPQQ